MDIRFSLLLKQAMQEYNVGSTKLGEILAEKGHDNITNKRISEYTTEISTPTLEKAKIIMEVLNFPISEEDLNESLKINRELIRDEKEERLLTEKGGYGRQLSVSIKLRNIIPGQAPIDNERRLFERVTELYGTNNMTKYVEELIAADLRQMRPKGENS